MTQKHVGILMGGMSAEKEVSISTGDAVYEALRSRGYRCTKIFVDHDIDRVLRSLEDGQTPIDVAFIALHGTYGEDGCIQGLLEVLRIPYTGSGVLASALAMDKLKSKELFRLYNVPTPPYYSLDKTGLDRLEEIHGSFGFPVFVKPRRGGSSVGAGRADSIAELRKRTEDALRFDNEVLVERHVTGKEIAVGILDGRALGAIEIVPKAGFYDYRSKYQPGRSEYHFPARLTPTRYKGVLNLAERANRALGTTSATRVDMLVTEGDNEYVLEVNTLPGMTATSLLPKIAKGAGYDFPGLCAAIVDRATLDHRIDSDADSTGVEPELEHRALALDAE
jgi:D-alanine-D-alanine ligase